MHGRRLYLIVLSFLLSYALSAQNLQSQGAQSLGIGVQIYPAGTIFNVKSAWTVGNKGALIGKLGYNIARRQDFGEHDKEEGGGPGFTFAYKRYLRTSFTGFFAEARMGMWFLDIDWADNQPAAAGNTDITVFQPTLGIGYTLPLKEDKLKLDILVAFGYEVNVITSGQEVGEGGISLIGAALSIPLKGSRKRSSAAITR